MRETGLGVVPMMISVSSVVGGPHVDGEVGPDLPLFPLPLPLPDGTISLVIISSCPNPGGGVASVPSFLVLDLPLFPVLHLSLLL